MREDRIAVRVEYNQVAMGSICEGWEGRTVDGKFPLLEWVGGWAHRCVFLTVRQALQKANIKLIVAGEEDADRYLAKWETARALSHPSLVQMMETGRSAIDGKDLVYVVTETAETFLSEVIPRKVLNPSQVESILDPIVDALSFVHEKGLVHGRVRPSNIVQVADRWKLAKDELVAGGELPKLIGGPGAYDAPEVATGNLTQAADLWSLGIIVVEAFEQRIPAWDPALKSDPTVPDSLPDPFLEIARRCLRREPAERCSIAVVRSLLAGGESLPSADESVWAAEPVQSGTVPPAPIAVAASPKAVERVQVEGERDGRPEKSIPITIHLADEVERVELSPRSRLFSDIDEEEEHKSHVGLILFGILVLLGAGGYVAVRQHWVDLPWPPQTPNAPAANQPSPSAQAPQAPPAESPSAPSDGQTAMQSQTPSETQSAPSTAQPAPETQQSASPSVEGSASPSAEKPKTAKPETKAEAPKEESAPREVTSTPQVVNSEGAVLKQVLPNVAPGASESMRGPVLVEVRVSVDEDGKVSNAQYMTHGPGNYFARIAREAARSWKFTPPAREGRPQASVWTLRFRFERRNTDVTATRLR